MTRRHFFSITPLGIAGLMLPQSPGILTIWVGEENVKVSLRRCFRKGKLIKTPSGIVFKVVVWNGYAPWSNSHSLIIRSIGGEYSTSRQIKSMNEDLEIRFK